MNNRISKKCPFTPNFDPPFEISRYAPAVTILILNNRQFYKEYYMKVIADIVTNSNMQQRIATGKSRLSSAKFHIVLQNTSNNKTHSK